jgi:autotransporter-associated beta strand protein
MISRLVTAIVSSLVTFAPAETSELWGNQGELWNPAGRLPDFSFAGYHSGETAIPSPSVVANVVNFGAVGDGIADDTTAFENAIAAASNGAVLVPAGRYKITRVLYIRKSDIVLRGAGQALTTLVFTKHLTELLGPPPGTAGLESWSWGGGLIWVEGDETTTKVADVTAPTDRGSSVLTVSSTAGLSVGHLIRLTMTDPDGSLGRHIHADQLNAHPTLVGRRLVRFPSKIAAISGNEITLERPLRLNVRTEWSPEIHTFSGHLEEVGLEGFTMEFPTRKYQGHFNEDGFNGIWMDGVWNSWVRDVGVHNFENGIMIERSAFCTLDDLSLTADVANRLNISGSYYTGHHGIQIRRSDDCMISNFDMPTRTYHDTTVEDATGTVFMKGSGVDLNFDHHTYLPYENLFTEIDAGTGTRHFSSSGSRDPESAARETLWNVASINSVTSLPNPAPSRGLWPQANFIGMKTTLATAKSPLNQWVEAITPASLTPVNLYEAQFSRRISPPAVVTRSLIWDGADTATPGAQGGSGTWETNITANWWNGSSNEPWPASGGTDDNTTFAGTAGTVTIAASGVAARTLTFNTAAYTLSGGTLVLNGTSPLITANHGGNTTNISSVIAGSSGLAKSGPSTVQLRAANRYSGDTRVLQGNLLIGLGNDRLPVTTRLILGDGENSGVFQMNSRSQEVGGLLTSGTGTGNRVINSNVSATTFTVNIANQADTHLFNGTLGGAAGNDNNYQFVKSGPGKLILAGDNTHAGNTTINGGVLQFGADGPTGSPGPAGITNHGTLRFDRSETLIVPNAISGTGGLHIDCPYAQGTIRLPNANTFEGGIAIPSGILSIGHSEALGNGAKSVELTTGFGTLQLDGEDLILPPTVTLNTSGEPAPGRIRNLIGNNTISGPVNLTLGAGSTLITSDGGSLTLAGNITAPLASRTLKLGGTSTGGNQITGTITETGPHVISVEKTGTGTWELGASNSYAGATLVSAGTLRVSNNSALGSTTSATTIHTGATLQLQGASLDIAENLTLGTGSTGATVENLSGENTLSGTITRNGALTLLSTSGKLTVLGDIGGTNNTLNLQGDGDGELSGSISSAFSVAKTGNGTWTLSGASTHSNSTTVSGGMLVLSGTLAGPLTVFSGTLAPDGSPSSTSNLNIQPNGRFEVRPGDSLTIGGSVTLAGNLDIIAPPGLGPGTGYVILDKTSAGSMSGSFSGKPEGSIFSASGYDWHITYKGGTGNDLALTIIPDSAIEQWRLTHFGTTENTGDAADSFDPNNDGETNLLEFATGQNPHAATRALTQLEFSGNEVQFTYSRNKDAFDEGYLFDVEYSDTLADPWNSVGPGTVLLEGPPQSVRALIPKGSAGRRFIRLRVNAP